MLIEPVSLIPPTQLGPVHFIAIGGAGMSAIAFLYAELGIAVSGSDQSDSLILQTLKDAGITVFVGHDPAQLGSAETVVVSSAIRDDNVELIAAREAGLRVWHRSAALGALILGRRGVAVTGTHGKTTTSAMVTRVLGSGGAEPGYVIGSTLADTGRASSLGTSADFVVEADESDGSFRQYPVETFVVTNIEADHLDNWGTPRAYYRGYAQAVRVPSVSRVVACADDAGAVRLTAELRAEDRRVVTFGTDQSADVRIVDESFTGVTSHAGLVIGEERYELSLGVPGQHNLRNAAAAIAVGLLHSIPAEDCTAALADFKGTSRRFEYVGDVDGVTIYDDYGHHPTEVAAALAAARIAVGTEGRVLACFQPHLFSRTLTFAVGFAEALAAADVAVVCPIYPAREVAIEGVTSDLIINPLRTMLGESDVYGVSSLDEAAVLLADLARPGDLIITVGAGDITSVAPRTLGLLESP